MNLKHLPLTSSGIRALSDGTYFLAHGRELLAGLALEPYCQFCRATGVDAAVRLAPDSIIANWTCGHTAGWASQKRRIELPDLLSALGWGIRCTACQADAQGDNSGTDPTFKVLCDCTVRLMANPVAEQSNAPAVALVGGDQHV